MTRALCLAVFFATSASMAQEAPSPAPAPAAVHDWSALSANEAFSLPAWPETPASAPALVPRVEAATPTQTAFSTKPPEGAPGKSPRHALGLALGVPLAGFGLCAATLGAATLRVSSSRIHENALLLASCIATPILGASAGHVYADERPRAIRSAGKRAAILAASTALGLSAGHLLFHGDPYGQAFGFVGGLGIGSAVGLGLAVREIIDAPKAARRTNQKHAAPAPAPAPRETTTARATFDPHTHPALRLPSRF
jgi:hypothetical protein